MMRFNVLALQDGVNLLSSVSYFCFNSLSVASIVVSFLIFLITHTILMGVDLLRYLVFGHSLEKRM